MQTVKRRKTSSVKVGSVVIGSEHPIVVQSMTNTPTNDIKSTFDQIIDLVKAGSEIVRITINDDNAAKSAVKIIKRLKKNGYDTPIIGDFHYNGHLLLERHPECAKLLAKYRINPGNVGSGKSKDSNFEKIIRIAVKNNKPVRIGVNWGSIDQELLNKLKNKHTKSGQKKSFKEISHEAMVKSALSSAKLAESIGLKNNKIILSVKMSELQDMVKVNLLLAKKCSYPVHLGLTEAGGGIKGTVSSSAALAILLQQGIGDTIRVSLTPQPNVSRSMEVKICKELLQSMGLRFFSPTVISCPGCGRTDSAYFQELAVNVQEHIDKNIGLWKKKYKGVEKLKIAVMGCVVNGPGESEHADIGISLPGKTEEPLAPIYINGKKQAVLKGTSLKKDFLKIIEKYIKNSYIAV